MKMSVFQVVLMGLFAAGAMFGIFVFATYSGGGSSDADAVGKVVIWGTLPKEGVQDALRELQRTNKSFESVSYVEKNADTLPSDLASAIAVGGGPDLLLASQEHVIALSKFIVPITTETLPPNTFANTFVDGGSVFTVGAGSGYYGMPLLVDPLILFWNDDILASNGITKPPSTWEALVGFVPTLAVLTPSKQITRSAIALGTYSNIENARGILSALFLQTGVPITSYEQTGIKANLGESGTGAGSGRAVLNFYTQFADPAKISYTWNSSLPNSRQMFQTGDLALYLGYASEARSLAALNPNLNFKVTTLPQPGTAKLKTTYGQLYGLMISRGSKNAIGAFKVMAKLTSAPEQGKIAGYTGLAPAVRTALTTLPADPAASVAYTSALYTRGWLSPAPVLTDPVFSSMIGNVMTGRISPESALNRAAASLSSLLRQ